MNGGQTPTCIHCGKDENQVPLVSIHYQEGKYWICTEHFPILIHNPAQLSGKLPNAETLSPAEHD
jgi:hypothetical protein